MKQTLIISLILSSISFVQAQDIFTDMPRVQVHQDSAIVRLLQDKIEGVERHETEAQGFRVQVFSSNNQLRAKADAFDMETRLSKLHLDQPVYVLYNPPFWKVRVGDLRTQEDAIVLRDELIKLLPDIVGDIYVVKDKITVIE